MKPTENAYLESYQSKRAALMEDELRTFTEALNFLLQDAAERSKNLGDPSNELSGNLTRARMSFIAPTPNIFLRMGQLGEVLNVVFGRYISELRSADAQLKNIFKELVYQYISMAQKAEDEKLQQLAGEVAARAEKAILES